MDRASNARIEPTVIVIKPEGVDLQLVEPNEFMQTLSSFKFPKYPRVTNKSTQFSAREKIDSRVLVSIASQTACPRGGGTAEVENGYLQLTGVTCDSSIQTEKSADQRGESSTGQSLGKESEILHDVATQGNRTQTGVVKPVLRRERDCSSLKNLTSRDAFTVEESKERSKSQINLLFERLKELKNLAINGHYDSPSSLTKIMVKFTDHIMGICHNVLCGEDKPEDVEIEELRKMKCWDWTRDTMQHRSRRNSPEAQDMRERQVLRAEIHGHNRVVKNISSSNLRSDRNTKRSARQAKPRKISQKSNLSPRVAKRRASSPIPHPVKRPAPKDPRLMKYQRLDLEERLQANIEEECLILAAENRKLVAFENGIARFGRTPSSGVGGMDCRAVIERQRNAHNPPPSLLSKHWSE